MLDVRIFLGEPVGCGSEEELVDGDALAADEEFGRWVVSFVEGGDAGQRLLATAALDLDGDEGVATLEDEIDFEVALAPVGDLDSCAAGRVDQVSADGGLDQAAPGIAVRAPSIWWAAGLSGHERGVEDLEFWTGSALTDLVSGKFLQTGDHARTF